MCFGFKKIKARQHIIFIEVKVKQIGTTYAKMKAFFSNFIAHTKFHNYQRDVIIDFLSILSKS